MIPVPPGVHVWLAVGHTGMRRGMQSLALQVQQVLGRDPHAGDLYVFRGRRADLVRIVWHDGIGMSLHMKRLERGRSIWPSPADGCVATAGAQLAYMLDGIDWRNPQRTWRPGVVGRCRAAAHSDWFRRGVCDSILGVSPVPDSLPDAVAALQAALAAERPARQVAEARASGAEAMVAHLKPLIAKLKHDRFGASSERGRKPIDQLELELGELVAAASEDATTAENAGDKDGPASGSGTTSRRRPARAPLPDHLPRERVVIPAPSACPCCGGRPSRLGEDITETLEVVPRQWKVVQTVRGRCFSCRSCEAITQPPAPFHPIARGRAGPQLLAMVLEAKFGQHLPLNRLSETYAREGVELGVSTIADRVGACTAGLAPLMALIDAHVLAAARLHGDDTTVPVLATGRRTITGRVWTYVRDDRPFAGPAPPAATFRYSRDRTGEHPQRHLAGYQGILQADAYAGFNELYAPSRRPGPITEAACWAHGRRKLLKLAEVARAPLAAEAVRRIDAIFAAERTINGLPAARRPAVRQRQIVPLVAELETWMRGRRARMSRHAEVGKAMDYMLTRWDAFSRFLTDGRICLTNNAAEREPRGVAPGRRAWMFAGSDRGGERAAAMYSPIATAKLNGVDPRAWPADVLARIADHPASRLHELLPWHWKAAQATHAAEAA